MTNNGLFPLQTRVVASQGQISCDLEGESVVLDLRSGTYYGLNQVAATVWRLVQEPRTIEEIRGAILQDYDVTAEDCARDLQFLLQQLADWKLIELKNGKPDPR